MGRARGKDVKTAVNYLLSILANEPTVNYSRFYDGTAKTAKTISRGMGFEWHEYFDDGYAAIMLDIAAGWLAEHDYVECRELPNELVDGDKDYEITLTNDGAVLIPAGTEFEIPDMIV